MFNRENLFQNSAENAESVVEDAVVVVEEPEAAPVVEEAVVVEEAPVEQPVEKAVKDSGKYPGVAALSAGQKNESVSKVQRELSAKGFAVAVTGTYDRATENAVALFCKSKGVHADGTQVGPKTWKHLFG